MQGGCLQVCLTIQVLNFKGQNSYKENFVKKEKKWTTMITAIKITLKADISFKKQKLRHYLLALIILAKILKS